MPILTFCPGRSNKFSLAPDGSAEVESPLLHNLIWKNLDIGDEWNCLKVDCSGARGNLS